MGIRTIPLSERVSRTGIRLREAQRALFLLPVETFCDFMVQELGREEYASFCRKYLPDGDGSQTISQAVSWARKLLWEHEYQNVPAPVRDRSRARFVLDMLLVQPFLLLEQAEAPAEQKNRKG